MPVLENVGCCRSCGGILEILTAHLPTVTVACAECSDTYVVQDGATTDNRDAGSPESPAKEVTP